ncbi:MAG: alpha/beta fold hydrolase [Acidobacteria bacterium]|nr:alpha/beta fold hydrolase [Acidobacteriota bacterium]MCI0723171.1 alpha/beta fold hydrolase [Acidobacteriota bacterium]
MNFQEFKSTGFAPVNGTNLYYEISGQGQPLVLINAGGIDCSMWDQQFSGLAENFQVVRYDPRGLGKSTDPPDKPFSAAHDLLGLLRFLKLERPSLLGSSLGASIAVDFVLYSPEMVSHLILVAPALGGYQYSPAFFQKLTTNMAMKQDGRILRWIQWCLDEPFPGIRLMAKQFFPMLPLNPEVLKLPVPPAIGRLAEIHLPTLVMVGEQDEPDIHSIAEIISTCVPGALKVTLVGVGHMLNKEKPGEFNQVVKDFLLSNAPAPNRESPFGEKIRISALDRDWNHIDQLIFEAAGRIKNRVYSVVEQRLESTEFAEDILQSAVLSVSQTLRRSPQDIDDLESYLFRSVLRELERFLANVEPAEYFDPEVLARLARDETWSRKMEDNLFIRDFVNLMDLRTRQFYKLRSEGYKWREIGELFQMSAHHAKVSFDEGFQRALAQLLKDNPSLKLVKGKKA